MDWRTQKYSGQLWFFTLFGQVVKFYKKEHLIIVLFKIRES